MLYIVFVFFLALIGLDRRGIRKGGFISFLQRAAAFLYRSL